MSTIDLMIDEENEDYEDENDSESYEGENDGQGYEGYEGVGEGGLGVDEGAAEGGRREVEGEGAAGKEARRSGAGLPPLAQSCISAETGTEYV